MENKELLNEEKYQNISKSVKKTSKMLFITGGVMIVISIILIIVGFFSKSDSGFVAFGIGGFMLVISTALIGFASQMFFVGHGREITAFMAQQHMPIVKEGTEKMAPAIKQTAQAITEGVKEGLEDK